MAVHEQGPPPTKPTKATRTLRVNTVPAALHSRLVHSTIRPSGRANDVNSNDIFESAADPLGAAPARLDEPWM